MKNFEQQTDSLFAHLDRLEHAHSVHFDGQLPELASDLDQWRARTTVVAEKVAVLGISLTVETDGRTLHVMPGSATNGTHIEGPLLQADVGGRIERTVRRKALQVTAAATASLWMENHGALDKLNGFYQLTPHQQVRAMRDLTSPALAEFPHMRGLTFSTEWRHVQSQPSPEHEVRVDSSSLLVTPLWPGRTRSSITVPNGPNHAASAIEQLMAAEQGWLDWALLEVAGVRVSDLVFYERL